MISFVYYLVMLTLILVPHMILVQYMKVGLGGAHCVTCKHVMPTKVENISHDLAKVSPYNLVLYMYVPEQKCWF